MMADPYLRRGRRKLLCWLEKPGVSGTVCALAYGLGGFLLTASSLRGTFQPIAMGLISALSGWQALAMALGSMAGYRFFWGSAGIQGTVWAAAGALLALLGGRQKRLRQEPQWIALLAASLNGALGLLYQGIFHGETELLTFLMRILLAGASAALGNQLLYHRDSVTDWIAGGVLTLGLAQVAVLPYVSLGCIAAGWLAVTGVFPAAALAGLGLDLARITPMPMTAVLGIGYFLRMIPFSDRWVRSLCPTAAYVLTALLLGAWDPAPLPGLILGGTLGLLLPGRSQTVFRRGPTGAAQVKLELSSGVMGRMQEIFLEQTEPPIDEKALLQKARGRACGSCAFRKTCTVQKTLKPFLLRNPLEVHCQKTGRLVSELRRSQEQLRVMILERARRQEYRAALIQQYGFLSKYLQYLADRLPRRDSLREPSFSVQVSARSHRKEQANGDCCIAFPGVGCRYYVLLCDGMGTGIGAAEESRTAAELMKSLLKSGCPPEFVLQNINSLLVLRGQAGAVTVDLAELQLDSGKATLYKWGAAPSWLIRRGRAEKIGTAAAPPGISLGETREAVKRLSLSRGEVLVLLSDGVDGEAALHQMEWTAEATTGELAERLLSRGRGQSEDDATAAVLRLRPTSLVT